MKITAFDVEGIHVVARCFVHGDRWKAQVVPKKERSYLESLWVRFEASDSSELAAKAQVIVQDVDNIVGGVIHVQQRYENEIRKYLDDLAKKESGDDA